MFGPVWLQLSSDEESLNAVWIYGGISFRKVIPPLWMEWLDTHLKPEELDGSRPCQLPVQLLWETPSWWPVWFISKGSSTHSVDFLPH